MSTYPEKNILINFSLGFHDCIGGCDGCLNLKNENNAGLGPIVSSLENKFLENRFSVSRADFWALAATVAVERGVSIANQQPACGCEEE
jgi:hypothetical protein